MSDRAVDEPAGPAEPVHGRVSPPTPVPASGSDKGGGFILLAVMTLASALISASMYVVPVLGPTMTPAFGVSPLAVGHYVSLIFVGSIVGGALGGDFVMRYGPIRVHQAALVAGVLGMALMLAGSLVLAVLSALLIGVGSGASTPAASQMLRRSTPADRMNLAFSIRQTGVPLGGVLAGLFAPMLEARLGWQGALIAVVAVSLPLVALLQPMRRTLDDARASSHRITLSSLADMPAAVRAAPGLGTLALVSVGFAAAQMSLTGYFVTYLHEHAGHSLVAAARCCR
jgi:MFS family permease